MPIFVLLVVLVLGVGLGCLFIGFILSFFIASFFGVTVVTTGFWGYVGLGLTASLITFINSLLWGLLGVALGVND